MQNKPTQAMRIGVLASAVLGVAGAQASGYRIPEQSVNATALAAAYVANAQGADASYYNPAAMVFNSGGAAIQGNLTYINLPGIDFQGAPGNDTSKEEHFLIPTLHYVSPAVGKARFGLSIVTPAGLTKRWSGPGAASAQKFELKTVELNPTVGYKVTDHLAIGGGARVIYSKGKVTSSSSALPAVPIARDLEGDSFDYGFNLAIHFKPNDKVDIAATYRSNIDLTESGTATLSNIALVVPAFPARSWTGDASVTVPSPAVLSLATALDFSSDTTVELVFERTYWSTYKSLDFNYSVNYNADPLWANFDRPQARNWQDSNTYRIGITHRYNSNWTAMAGFAYDETPAPANNLGFELPDSNAKIYALGAKYAYSKQLEVGGAILYSDKDTRAANNAASAATPVGTFSNAGALLVSLGAEYRFN